MVTRRYSVYGLVIEASGDDIPTLIPMSGSNSEPDIFLVFGALPDWPAVLIERLGRVGELTDDPLGAQMSRFAFQHDGVAFERWLYDDGLLVILRSDGRAVWMTWPDRIGRDYAALMLLGPVLGWVVHRMGAVCLHAGAVSIGGRALSLAGPSGAGKSSSMAVFHRLGYTVLSEDHLVLDRDAGGWRVRAGYPVIRLWADSAGAVSDDELPVLVKGLDKRYLELPAHGAAAATLGGLCLLEPRAGEALSLERLRGPDVVKRLMGMLYGIRLMSREERAAQFELVSALAADVPVFSARLPNRLDALPEMCRQLATWFESLAPNHAVAA